MPLSQRSRTALYTHLEPIVGDDAIEELLTCIPATEDDEPITKHFLRAEMAEQGQSLRAELAEQGQSLRAELAEQGQSLRAEIAELGHRLDVGLNEGRHELAEQGHALRAEMAHLRIDLLKAMHHQTAWLIATMLAFAGLLIAYGHVVGH